MECEKLYDVGFAHFQKEWPTGPGTQWEAAQPKYGFYSPSKNTCIIKVVSESPEPHKSMVWFWGTLENKVLVSADDRDGAVVSSQVMWDKAAQEEADLRK